VELIDFLLITFIFGEFFLFLAVASYFGKRKEKREKTKRKDFPFFEAVWTKSKIVYTVYPDHLEIFVPTSRVEIQEKRRPSH
jgi:hypothetical protein